jgi:hypothetical protein
MTRVLPVVVVPVLAEPELEFELEHAASPPASMAVAAIARTRLWLCNLLILLVFLSLVDMD